MALAPSLVLLEVPSSFSRKSSTAFWLLTSIPDLTNSGAMMSLTLETALVTPVKAEPLTKVSVIHSACQDDAQPVQVVLTLAEVAGLVAISELTSLPLSGRST